MKLTFFVGVMSSDLAIDWPDQTGAKTRPALKLKAKQKAAVRKSMLNHFKFFLDQQICKVDESMRQKVDDALKLLE